MVRLADLLSQSIVARLALVCRAWRCILTPNADHGGSGANRRCPRCYTSTFGVVHSLQECIKRSNRRQGLYKYFNFMSGCVAGEHAVRVIRELLFVSGEEAYARYVESTLIGDVEFYLFDYVTFPAALRQLTSRLIAGGQLLYTLDFLSHNRALLYTKDFGTVILTKQYVIVPSFTLGRRGQLRARLDSITSFFAADFQRVAFVFRRGTFYVGDQDCGRPVSQCCFCNNAALCRLEAAYTARGHSVRSLVPTDVTGTDHFVCPHCLGTDGHTTWSQWTMRLCLDSNLDSRGDADTGVSHLRCRHGVCRTGCRADVHVVSPGSVRACCSSNRRLWARASPVPVHSDPTSRDLRLLRLLAPNLDVARSRHAKLQRSYSSTSSG
jgi:hypothetical protein